MKKMVKHIVCFKLKEFSKENAAEAKRVLLGMVGNVPQLKGIEVNIDELRSQRSFDIMLEVLVNGWEELNAYQNDPYHCGVVKVYMHAHTEKSIAMDYEIKEEVNND